MTANLARPIRLCSCQTPAATPPASVSRLRPLAAASALALWAAVTPGVAQAQNVEAPAAAAAASAPADGLQLDRIVITGSGGTTSKMRSSIAISTVEGDSIVINTARSATEVLRSVPGLRSESSSGDSNANIGVRGIPISAGGARYIQFQEDGLPVLQFGDIAFATPDTWLRVDHGLDRLEVLRGGSASTLATGAPGGIINYLTKTGRDAGGSIEASVGLGYDEKRVDLDYGGSISDRTRYWVGGFFHDGDGGRKGADGTVNGGQIRGNLTQDFDAGFVRVSFKHLDDHTPTFLPTPVRYQGGKIVEIPGLDPRKAAFYNADWPLDNTLGANNERVTADIRDGLTAKSDALGLAAEFELGAGVRLQNHFRWARNRGRFIGIFPGSDVAAAPAGTTFANGGGAYSGDQFTAVIFNTKVDDAGIVANDLRLSRDFQLGDGAKGGAGTLTATGGFYASRQNLDLTWNFNQYSLTAAQEGARLLNVPGAGNGDPAFGGCCSNHQESTYKTAAPYALLSWDNGVLRIDGSVRRDENSASGFYRQSNAGLAYDLSTANRIDYDFGNTSYSVGANYQLDSDFALFARVSKGAAYNADRITFFNPPALVNGSSPTIPINEVKQVEGGVKFRSGGFNLFATLFQAKTDEINVDVTTTPVRVTRNQYDAKGVELELAYRYGIFRMQGGLTYTDAEITASSNAALVGTTPKRQAKLVYQVTPSVYLGDNLQLGASVVGTTASKDDGPGGPVTITLPAYASVNALASYAFTPQITLALSVNNLFNTIGYTESNDGRGAARSITGRTARASLRYTF